MKSNTIVHAAIRNIGDANDSGEFFEGQLKEAIMWIAGRLGSGTMAKRFVIGIGRDRAGAAAGVDLKRGSGAGMTDQLEGALDALFAGESADDIVAGIPGPDRDPRDTYQGPGPGGFAL